MIAGMDRAVMSRMESHGRNKRRKQQRPITLDRRKSTADVFEQVALGIRPISVHTTSDALHRRSRTRR